LILQYLPVSTPRLVEPFCRSAALSIAAAARYELNQKHIQS
jgi:hypothetical protein